MGFLSDVWEGVKSVASGIWEGAKATVRTISKIGPTVLAVAKPVVKALCTIAPALGVPLQTALNFAETVVKVASIATGIIGPDESVSEIGEKSLEAAEQGIHPENYENADEYLDAVRNTPLAKDRNKWSDEERSVAGISTLAYCLEEKFNISPEVYPLFVRYHNFFTQKRERDYIDYALKTGKDISVIIDYFSTNSTMAEKEAAFAFMEAAEEATNPNFNQEQFEEELLQAKSSSPKSMAD